MIFFIDTNIFLRVFIKDNEGQAIYSRQFLNEIKNGNLKAATSSLVLAEVGWTLNSFYKYDRLKIAKLLNSIINLSGLTIVDKVDWPVALAHFQTKKIKLIDSLIASGKQIREKKWVVATYDKDFKKIDTISLKPEEIIASYT